MSIMDTVKPMEAGMVESTWRRDRQRCVALNIRVREACLAVARPEWWTSGAARSGMSRQQYGRYRVVGGNLPGEEVLHRLAAALGLPPGGLLWSPGDVLDWPVAPVEPEGILMDIAPATVTNAVEALAAALNGLMGPQGAGFDVTMDSRSVTVTRQQPSDSITFNNKASDNDQDEDDDDDDIDSLFL